MPNETSWKAEKTAPQGTGVLTKAFDILDEIALQQGQANARDIADATGIARPTLYRILSAMTARGIVRCDPVSHSYQIGFRTLDIAQQVWSSSNLSAISAGELRRLRDITGETTYLAVPEGDGVLSIGRFQGPHSRRSSAELGSIKPMHCTSQGKALLAFLPERQRAKFMAQPLDRRTEKTITEHSALEAELSAIRNRGYAVDDEEIVLGTRCVGAPILGSDGTAIAAISIAGPTFRVTIERVKFLAKEVAEAARIIGAQVNPETRKRPRGADFQPVSKQAAFIGGAPQWDAKRNSLFWIDHLAPALFESDQNGTQLVQEFDNRIDALALTRGFGPFVFTGHTALRLRDSARFDLPEPVIAAATMRSNDEILVMFRHGENGVQLRRMLPTGKLSEKAIVTGPASGFCISSDEGTAFIASRTSGTVTRLDLATEKSRVLSRIPQAAGSPVSCAVDMQGRVWVALAHGWSLARLDEIGEIAERVPVPTPNPTGLCFGGETGTNLYVTTERYGLDRNDLTNAPLSGHTLRLAD